MSRGQENDLRAPLAGIGAIGLVDGSTGCGKSGVSSVSPSTKRVRCQLTPNPVSATALSSTAEEDRAVRI